MSRNKRFLSLGCTVVFLLAAFAACGGKKAAAAPPLRVGWFVWNGWYPMAVAKELDLFRKHGANIEPLLYSSYSQLVPDFAAGKLDGVFAGLYELLKAGIPDIKVVLVTDFSEGAEGLVVDASIHTPADLVGKRLGVQGALSGSEFVITTFLRKNGFTPQQVVLIDVPPENIVDAMPHNIQGGYTWDPYLSQAVKKGYRVLFTTADVPGMVPDVVAFHQRTARERGEELRGFTAAWFEAVEYWRQHPREAVRIIARVTGLRPEEITRQGCRLLDRQANLSLFTPGSDPRSIYFTGEKQVEFFIGVGDSSVHPDLASILDPAFLQPPRR